MNWDLGRFWDWEEIKDEYFEEWVLKGSKNILFERTLYFKPFIVQEMPKQVRHDKQGMYFFYISSFYAKFRRLPVMSNSFQHLLSIKGKMNILRNQHKAFLSQKEKETFSENRF